MYTCTRTFEKLEYLDHFRKGNLRFCELDFYKKLEGNTREDKNEGSSSLWQPKKSIIHIGDIEIPTSDLAGPIILTSHTEPRHIFCLSAFYCIQKNKEFETKEEFLKNISRPTSNVADKFGNHTVLITNLKEFFKRVDKAIMKENKSFERGLVEYIDFNTFHGQIDKPGFTKDNFYKSESEYRIAIKNLDTSPFYLNIGNIEDITQIIENNQLDLFDIKTK